MYGELLRAGAEIYEYEPAMIHTKSMIVDRAWSVVGSTNFDNRSFGLNDEVNLADRRSVDRMRQGEVGSEVDRRRRQITEADTDEAAIGRKLD